MAPEASPEALRFAVGDRVACNMGRRGWSLGTVVKLRYREPHWPASRVAPYQVQLDESFGGSLIFAPADIPQVVRSEARAPLGTPSRPSGGGDAAAARTALAAELPALRALPFVRRAGTPEAMPVAEADGELVAADDSKGPWILAVVLEGSERSGYSGPYEVRLKVNAAWPKSAAEVRFLSIIHHQMVEDDGLVDPAALVDATELAGEAGEVSPAEAAPHSLCGVLRGVRLLLDDPASLLDGADETMLEGEMDLNSKRIKVMSSYLPQRLHRCLFDPEQAWIQDRFDPLFWAAHQAGTTEALKGLVREEAWDVYSLPFFTADFCDMFIEEIYSFYASGLPARRPNSMNNYGVVVNEIGMEQALDRLQQEFLLPVARALFQGVGSYFDGHHSFIVRYKVGEDLGLDLHTDDSDVTFNICLGKDFRGAGLRFCGNQGSAHHRHASALYFHEKGRCVVHLGHRRHGADDITEGERLNLIIWNKNSEYRRSKAYLRYNMQARDTGYERESGPPDKVCLSYTHDRDYGVFADYTVKTQPSRGRGWCPPRHAEYEGFREEVAA